MYQLDDLRELLELAFELSLELKRTEVEAELEVPQLDAIEAINLAQLADTELALLEALAEELGSLEQGESAPGVESLFAAEILNFFLSELILRAVATETSSLGELFRVIAGHLDKHGGSSREGLNLCKRESFPLVTRGKPEELSD